MTITSYKIQRYSLLSLILLTVLLLMTSSRTVTVKAQELLTDPVVEEIFNTLTPNERVGQVFIVSFHGNNVGDSSDIAALIQNYHIGGVAISTANKNFSNMINTPVQVFALTNALQRLVKKSSPINPIPLFIAVSHEGNGFPYTQMRSGLIALPSQMALGATWNSENARQVGSVVGQELSLLGVNMLFGPSLDVLDDPRPELGGSLGVRTFGGHPYWVGKMGQAYISGVHQGSGGQILTIAKHFPGFGSSNRTINEVAPTIIASLDDLRKMEFAPFFKVTKIEPDNPAAVDGITDGLMTTHVRYQGLSGNASISLDARNLPAILALKEFAPWHKAGGLVVSAPLGAPAALEGITSSNENFPARRLAQDALLAGNDLLFLSNFAFEDNPPEETDNIKNSIEFFQEKYSNDPNFQVAVDKAVRRIIKAKIKIYGQNLLTVKAEKPSENLNKLSGITIDINQIAQAGVTLITPLQDGASPLSSLPQPDDNILIFTDNRQGSDCTGCPEFPLIETTALQDIILELFGPNSTGQINPEQITSLSFVDLKQMLNTDAQQQPANNTDTEALIQAADWIIFVMLDINTELYPQSDAVRVLLRNRYDSLRNKKLILFAFSEPYFLDETEISQLTAYYAFYSKGRNYLETSARLLFQQFEPSGASPVAISAIGPLDLSPDPDQTIQLEPIHKINTNNLIVPLAESADILNSLDLEVGESILFRTGIIVDKNGHPVPDETPVDVFRFYPLEGLSLEPLTAYTINGVAEIIIIKERDTPLQIRASSDLAARGIPFDIGPGIIDTPTPTATSTPPPTATPVPLPTDTSTPTVVPTNEPTEEAVHLSDTSDSSTQLESATPVGFTDLVYSLLGMIIIGIIAFTLGKDSFSLEERVRPSLVAIAFGLVGYIMYIIAARYFSNYYYTSGHWVAPLISLLFAIGGMATWHLKPGRILKRD